MKGLVIVLVVLLAIAMPCTAQDTEIAYVYATVSDELEFISVPGMTSWHMPNRYGWNSYPENPLSIDFYANVDWTLSFRDPTGNGHMVDSLGNQLSNPFNLYNPSEPYYDLYLTGSDEVLGTGAASASAISFPVQYWQWLDYDSQGGYSVSILYSLTPRLVTSSNADAASRPAPLGR